MKRGGVTLIEIILVLVIVGIGAVLAVPRIQVGIENKTSKQALFTLMTIANAAKMHRVDTGSWPTTISNLEPYDAATNLLGKGYVKPVEYFHQYVSGVTPAGVQYSFVSSVTLDPNLWRVQGEFVRCVGPMGSCTVVTDRTISFENSASGGSFTDSKGVFSGPYDTFMDQFGS